MSQPARRQERAARLEAFERKAERPRYALALLWLPILVASRTVTSPEWLARLLDVGANLIWVSFLVDYVGRLWLAPARRAYFRSHLFDLVALMLPPIRALWGLTALRAVLRQPGVVFFLVSSLVVVGVGTVLVLLIERDAPGANIRSFGDAAWWAFATATTVGYGDHTPVSGIGRLVAGGLMVVGVALYSVMTAHVAAYVMGRAPSRSEQDLAARLDVLSEQVSAVQRALVDAGAGSASGDRHG